MKLSEAHRTIDATAGFLRHLQSLENANLVEVEDDEEGLGVLAVQVYTTGTPPNSVRKCRFKYRSGDEFEFIVPQIAPVCDLLIDNWPSLSAKKLRSHIEETNVLYLANDILGLNDPMMYETGSEAYEYQSLLGGRPSLLLYEIYDMNYRLAYALRMTEDEELDKKQEYTVAEKKRNYAKEIDWVRATKSFNLNSIKDVVKTGRNKHERRTIIKAIRDAMISTGEMYKIPYSVDSLLMDLFKENGGSRKALLKAYDESNETLFIDDFIRYAIEEYMESHTATDADIDEIFAEDNKKGSETEKETTQESGTSQNDSPSEENKLPDCSGAPKKCFRYPNDFTRLFVGKVVNDYYLGSYANLALIEVTLYDHQQLIKRASHTAFVKSLVFWGFIEVKDAKALNKIIRAVADKYKRLREEGYKEWPESCKNDKDTCIKIGNSLDPSMKYLRKTEE